MSSGELLPFPRVLRIEPASKCNLACSHCPTGTVDMDRGVMSEAVFSRLLEEIRHNKDFIKVVVLYHGGEPLLNRKFFDMVAQVREISDSFLIKTVSNGMVLPPERANQVLASGLDVIEFSLDGESSDESEFVREKSRTGRIVDNIENLINLKTSLGVAKPEIYIVTTQFLRDKPQDGTQVSPPSTPFMARTNFPR